MATFGFWVPWDPWDPAPTSVEQATPTAIVDTKSLTVM